MKLALIQMKNVQDNDRNIQIAVEKISEAVSLGADFIVLPEMFCCPYKTSNFPVYAQEEGGKNWKIMSDTARKYGVYICAGSMPERCCDKIFNTSYVFDRNGAQIAKHRKMHLFDCDLPGGANFHESDILSAGDEITVFDTEFGKIGLIICFDIRFPELSRLIMEKGAELVIVPAAFNMTSGPKWWEIMFRTRATDNQFFMAGCSPARDENASYVAYGNSMIVDPFGSVLARLDEKEGMILYDLNLQSVDSFRNQNNILKLRRLDLYETKWK